MKRWSVATGLAALVALGATQSVAAHDGIDLTRNLPTSGVTLGAVGEHATVLGVGAFDAFSPVAGTGRNVEYVGGHNGFTGGHVVVEGKRLYVGSYGRGMHIYDIGADPRTPRKIGQYVPGGPRADAPPDAAQFDGRQIAVLNGTRRSTTHSAAPGDARTDRTEFLDVTDPAKPRLLWTFGPDQVDGESHNGDIVDKRRLYFPSGGTGTGEKSQGLRIYDLNPLLETPAKAPANIFRGDPVALWEKSPYRSQSEPVGAPFTHTHDITIYTDHYVDGLGRRDIALLAEGGNYAGNGDTGSIFVIDVTDPRAPVVLLRWLHEKGSAHHPIRYHHEAQFLDGDPRLMLVTDEDMHNGCGGAGGVTAVRLSPDLQSAREESEWFVPRGTPAPVCSVHVFDSKGTRVYLGSYNAGLQVVDYADPANPRQVGYYIAEGTTAWGADIHKGYVYVGDMTRGLDVFQFAGDKKQSKPRRGSTRRTRTR